MQNYYRKRKKDDRVCGRMEEVQSLLGGRTWGEKRRELNMIRVRLNSVEKGGEKKEKKQKEGKQEEAGKERRETG